MQDPWTGKRLGNYELGARLGRGGMASVYAATHVALGTPHAVKLLDPELAGFADVRARFLREGRMQAQFRHPGVVRVTDTINEGAVGLVMERLSGRSVRELLEHGVLTLDEALYILEHVAEALDYVHERGVVHRDIKPGNLFLADRGGGEVRPTLIDFGVARMEEMNRLTRAGTFIGTPSYMSPEQFEDPSGVDGRSDTFSLAVTLFEMLAGFTPHHGDTRPALAMSIMTGRFDRISRCSSAPAALDAVFERALAVEASDRFESAGVFAAAVRDAVHPSQPEVEGLTVSPGPLPYAPTWPPVSEDEVAAVLAAREADGRSCRQCGLTNPEGRVLCLRCGAPL